ncbi:host-nuclease inhibitor Gam family protein, partial [Salmonella enterica]|uniref:host-nuclease inhibitor Gam family protein n=1 Tax=Salmonella enterica TaxID=28901 RepID=UPI003D219BC7
MAKRISRLKAAAASYTPQSREQVSVDIKKIGDIQRELTRIETDANDQIAIIMNQNTPKIEALRAELDVLQKGVQTWCEANRADITKEGKTKTANLITGEVSWRTKPDSVS